MPWQTSLTPFHFHLNPNAVSRRRLAQLLRDVWLRGESLVSGSSSRTTSARVSQTRDGVLYPSLPIVERGHKVRAQYAHPLNQRDSRQPPSRINDWISLTRTQLVHSNQRPHALREQAATERLRDLFPSKPRRASPSLDFHPPSLALR